MTVNMSMEYGPNGQLMRQDVGGNTEHFLYEGAELHTTYDASFQRTKRYVHGPGLDRKVGVVPYTSGDPDNSRYFFATPNGSVHQVVEWSPLAGQPALADTELTSAWGVPILKDEIPALLNSPIIAPWSSDFGYTGRRKLGNSGLMDYRNRIYDPALGRFLTSDPIGTAGGMNTYAYVSGDPVNRVDPWGLEDQQPQQPPRQRRGRTILRDFWMVILGLLWSSEPPPAPSPPAAPAPVVPAPPVQPSRPAQAVDAEVEILLTPAEIRELQFAAIRSNSLAEARRARLRWKEARDDSLVLLGAATKAGMFLSPAPPASSAAKPADAAIRLLRGAEATERAGLVLPQVAQGERLLGADLGAASAASRTLAIPQRGAPHGPLAEGLSVLDAHQLSLHGRLTASTELGGIALRTGEVSFADLAALTRATGLEHAVARLQDGTRLLVRGTFDSVPHVGRLPVKRLIVHSHPGSTRLQMVPSGVNGDIGYIWAIGQRSSYIVTSGAQHADGVPYYLSRFYNDGFWRGVNTPPNVLAQGLAHGF